MAPQFFRDLLIVFGLAVLVVTVFSRVRVPSIIGFLLTGVACGPYGFGLIQLHDVETLAELGVIFLLFTVGIEFSLQQLAHIRVFLLAGGSLQVGLTLALVAAVAHLAGVPLSLAIFFGMLVAVSSTAICLRTLADRGEMDSPHAQAVLGISIFQDLCVVPMLLLVPLLSDAGQQMSALAWVAVKAVLFVGGSLFAARRIVPWLMTQVVKTGSREIFLLTVIFLCLGTAWATAAVGLSLAFGAFIAGLVISESEYSQQALGEVVPLREVFNSLFFVSMGMLFDIRILFQAPVPVFAGIGLVVLLKAAIITVVVFVLRGSLRVAVTAGLMMAQIGEFSFVLSKAGSAAGLLQPDLNQLFLAVAVGTMMLSPLLYAASPAVARFLEQTLRLKRAPVAPVTDEHGGALKDHVIIVGYGINGRNVARVLSHVKVPFVVITMSPDAVKQERPKGVPILYGDGTNIEVMLHAGIKQARVLVVAISDAAASRRATDLARRLNPGIHIIIRTRYLREMEPLFAAGANDVVPEEFETSIEIFSRVLERYLVPRDVVERCMWEVRQDGYEMFRATYSSYAAHRPAESVRRFLSEVSMEVYRVQPGSSVEGKRLADVRLRETAGVTVLAVQHTAGGLAVNPVPGETLEADDAVLLLGTPEQLARASGLFVTSGQATAI